MNADFPSLDKFRHLGRLLYPGPDADAESPLKNFEAGLNAAFDRIGFSESYVKNCAERLLKRHERDAAQVESSGAKITKVVKDIVWGMIELDATCVAILDSPILQRLRSIRQNGFTYLVFPSVSHVRLEHSLGVLAVVSKYIESINRSATQPRSYAEGLSAIEMSPELAMDLRHAALLHDIGHFPLSHVMEGILGAQPTKFTLGGASVLEFENEVMSALPDVRSELSEKLSVAIILSPRFQKFYSALRLDDTAYLRVACLITGLPMDVNKPGYSQLISGAVDCDKVDYLLRDSTMSNVPVAIDKARLFLNSALVKCETGTLRKLVAKGVLARKTDFERPALTLVLNSSGVDTIEEVAFSRATLYERVYRHSVTRNAERMLAVAIADSADAAQNPAFWLEALNSFTADDETFLQSLLDAASPLGQDLVRKIKFRQLPKRAFAFSPEFYSPIVPYVEIFSDVEAHRAASHYHHDVTSKDPFHDIVARLKESSTNFKSKSGHIEIEKRISERAMEMVKILKKTESSVPDGRPAVFFIPLPDHSASPSSCAFLTHEGELESSAKHSRAAQIVSAKEIGRSIGFVTCDSEWAEIVFLASQEILYDYFNGPVGHFDIDLTFGNAEQGDGRNERRFLKVKTMQRFYIAEDLAVRRCRLERGKLALYRRLLSQDGYYDRRPRLAKPESSTGESEEIAHKFREFSGQHNWRITESTVRHFLNQFPPAMREDAKSLLLSLNFLNRETASRTLWTAVRNTVEDIRKADQPASIHLVALAGTSARMMLELVKQENRPQLATLALQDRSSIHELLGVAKAGDAVIFVDDNVSSGTQFSAQMLAWLGVRDQSDDPAVLREAGIEANRLQPNEIALFSQLNVRLATCVGKPGSDQSIRSKLAPADQSIRFGGSLFGERLDAGSATLTLRAPFLEFLRKAGAGCIQTSGLKEANAEKDALGYENSEGRTVTLWNVPTSTYTALWCPGIVDGEPWFPLFIRRGYANKLIVA
ncbi:HD domain-containing protein [Bradyrhizobium sp. th.b2]|uniref:phosphoribosyltransferase-like protein n=1 Tax=Bradyrhizobium sp. th-b2 TaxID=172088 RepID=UPI000402A04A|nr:HD domain-containing protein [Bradyrhizobium sp. th.b2]